MDKIFRYILTMYPKCRRATAILILRMLCLLRDVESSEMWRCSDLLDSLETDVQNTGQSEYCHVERELITT